MKQLFSKSKPIKYTVTLTVVELLNDESTFDFSSAITTLHYRVYYISLLENAAAAYNRPKKRRLDLPAVFISSGQTGRGLNLTSQSICSSSSETYLIRRQTRQTDGPAASALHSTNDEQRLNSSLRRDATRRPLNERLSTNQYASAPAR